MFLLLESTTAHGRRSRRHRAGKLDTSVPPTVVTNLPQQTTYIYFNHLAEARSASLSATRRHNFSQEVRRAVGQAGGYRPVRSTGRSRWCGGRAVAEAGGRRGRVLAQDGVGCHGGLPERSWLT
ncbi:hypothetical protein E2C01_037738 [Portunus trituberculatus]|uniref:Uncharacterized protein n=1 Tax=Portunus trituberculatus TaxID=210409 RepID=A0A5B7FEW5_PORTR|nr:hypothetical protein [Portunus trituberculatus]